jgi:hypothetical protein
MDQIISTLQHNTEYRYTSILFKITMYIYNHKMYLKVIWNNKKETLKEVKHLRDLKNINIIIKQMVVDKK